jgi:hypothetical protein
MEVGNQLVGGWYNSKWEVGNVKEMGARLGMEVYGMSFLLLYKLCLIVWLSLVVLHIFVRFSISTDCI